MPRTKLLFSPSSSRMVAERCETNPRCPTRLDLSPLTEMAKDSAPSEMRDSLQKYGMSSQREGSQQWSGEPSGPEFVRSEPSAGSSSVSQEAKDRRSKEGTDFVSSATAVGRGRQQQVRCSTNTKQRLVRESFVAGRLEDRVPAGRLGKPILGRNVGAPLE